MEMNWKNMQVAMQVNIDYLQKQLFTGKGMAVL